MNKEDIKLVQDEEVVFEADGAILTNRRIFSNYGRRRGYKGSLEVNLSEVASFQKLTGGQESRQKVALQIFAVGVVALALTLTPIFQNGSKIDLVLFLVGMLGVVIGMYFGLQSVFRVRPHTTLLFTVPGGDDLPIYFEGRENPVADQFTRHFARTKRGI